MRKLALALILCLGPINVRGQSLASFRFQVDNDWFDFWQRSVDRPDELYTAGQGFNMVFDAAPKWARLDRQDCATAMRDTTALSSCVQSFAGVFQYIYTPIVDSPTPIPGDRPYAGLLQGEFGAQFDRPRQLSRLAIILGTTGRISGGEAAQKAFHKWADLRHPMGWQYQIATQPVLGLKYGAQYLLTPPRLERPRVATVVAAASALATTIQEEANAGLEIHAGLNPPHPWMPTSLRERRRIRAYGILGANESWVLRDALLEGNSDATRGLVEKKPFVFHYVWGLALGGGGYFIEYRATSMTRDYETGRWHRWGAISLIVGNPY
ncbi:MAG: lipid A-modifier LpxR family protein [Gemmatimonadaceae bacterium]